MLFCDPAPGAGKLRLNFKGKLSFSQNLPPYHHLVRSIVRVSTGL